jgi:hypothetical protein
LKLLPFSHPGTFFFTIIRRWSSYWLAWHSEIFLLKVSFLLPSWLLRS